MNTITFTVPGRCQPKQRPKKGRNGFYTPKPTKDYEASVADAAKKVMGNFKPLDGYISATVKIIEKIPNSFSKLKQRRAIAGDFLPTGKDLDNCLKSIFDGLNGVTYRDDSQIVSIEASRSYGEVEKCFVVIREIKNAGELA